MGPKGQEVQQYEACCVGLKLKRRSGTAGAKASRRRERLIIFGSKIEVNFWIARNLRVQSLLRVSNGPLPTLSLSLLCQFDL